MSTLGHQYDNSLVSNAFGFFASADEFHALRQRRRLGDYWRAV